MKITKRVMRYVSISLIAALIAGLLVIGTVLVWLYSSLPEYEGTVYVEGVSAPVTIVRDRYAIPHIEADNLNDALFALGYVLAQERLFQLELLRHQTQGRLAEILGAEHIAADTWVRLLRLPIDESRLRAAMSPDTVAAVESYRNGINAYLDGRSGPLPPEFLFLPGAPERWTVSDVARIGNAALLFPDGWSREIERLHLQSRLPADVFDAVMNRYDNIARERLFQIAASDHRTTPLLISATEQSGHGSNAWALGPSRSHHANTLFAADPHLPLMLPSIYFPVGMSTPDFDFQGFTVPGFPAFLGHTHSASWGITRAPLDVADLFVERITADGGQYMAPDGPADFEVRSEVIRVRGREPVHLRIRRTRHGPVISDHIDQVNDALAILPEQSLLSLAAPWIDDPDTLGKLLDRSLRFLGAGSVEELIAAIDQTIDCCGEYLILADAKGSIAIVTAAAVPVRSAGDGSLPVPGWTDDFDWQGFLSGERRAQVISPPTGFVFNANDPLVPGTAHAERMPLDGHRALRLWTLLHRNRRLSIDDNRAIQLDAKSLAAQELVEELIEIRAQSDLQRQALGLLAHWNGDMTPDLVAPTIFYAWLYELDNAIFVDERELLMLKLPAADLAVYERMLRQGSTWCDDLRTSARETCAEIASDAFRDAIELLTQRFGENVDAWAWGQVHVAVFRHPLSASLPMLRRYGERRIGAPGGADTINVGAPVFSESIFFGFSVGAVTRRLESPDNRTRNRFIFAPGVSGHPFSAHYDDLLETWARGEYLTAGKPLPEDQIGQLYLVPRP